MPRYRMTRDGSLVPHDRPRHRDPHRAWRYTYRWQQLRARVIAEEPCCRACGSRERPCADHIVPVSQGGAIWDRRNLQRLCASCNGRKGGSLG
jgi:5-methylcytosine-specific restriction protein A